MYLLHRICNTQQTQKKVNLKISEKSKADALWTLENYRNDINVGGSKQR